MIHFLSFDYDLMNHLLVLKIVVMYNVLYLVALD